VIVEFTVGLGLDSWGGSAPRERVHGPVFTTTVQFLAGVSAGVLSVLLIPQRLSPPSPLPGVSLILAPIGTGIVMYGLGEIWRDRGKKAPALFSFRAGAIFAFGMALVRFVHVEGWSPF
jgi:hypothetical protein